MTKTRALILCGSAFPCLTPWSFYAQTKRLFSALAKNIGPENIDVLFGSGNSPRGPTREADVHRESPVKGAGRSGDKFIPGIFPRNGPATKGEIVKIFSGISPENCRTLLLFVIGHGERSGGRDGEETSTILMWSPISVRSGIPRFRPRSLKISELKREIDKLDPKIGIRFVMSQCYSGGFHELALRRHSDRPVLSQRDIFGYTAAPATLPSHGASPQTDPGAAGGYGAAFAEVFSAAAGKKFRLADIHRRTLKKNSLADVPLTTTDHYLLSWHESLGLDREKRCAAMDLRIRSLEMKLEKIGKSIANIDKKKVDARFENLVRPWEDAVRANAVSKMTPDERRFEMKTLLPIETAAPPMPDPVTFLRNSMLSVLSGLTSAGTAGASRLANYAGRREQRLLAWAKRNAPNYGRVSERLNKLERMRKSLFKKGRGLYAMYVRAVGISIELKKTAAAAALRKLKNPRIEAEWEELLRRERTPTL